MTTSTNRTSALAIAAVLVLGLALGAAILRTGKAGDGHGHADDAPHADPAHDKDTAAPPRPRPPRR